MEDTQFVEYVGVILDVFVHKEIAQATFAFALFFTVHLTQAGLYLAFGLGGGDIVEPLTLHLQLA